MIYTVIFAAGGVLYTLMEIAWRGHSHISMALAGGLCLAGIYFTERRCTGLSLWLKAAIGALIITAVELIFGCVVNIALGMSVWDYSDRPFNLLGQICPLFTVIWYLISIPAFLICRRIIFLIGEVDEN